MTLPTGRPAGDRVAQDALAHERRLHHPDLCTYLPGDPAPGDSVRFVVDAEGFLRSRVMDDGPHRGSWQMLGCKPGLSLDESHRPRPWQEMIEADGPVSGLPDAWYIQRGEILDALCTAYGEAEDLLFHALGAFVVGARENCDPWVSEQSPDEDIIGQAENVARRLEEAAAAVRAAVADAHLITKSASVNGV